VLHRWHPHGRLCSPCPSPGTSGTILVVAVVGLAAAIAGAVALHQRLPAGMVKVRHVTPTLPGSLPITWVAQLRRPRVQVAVSFLQVAAATNMVYPIPWPPAANALLDVAKLALVRAVPVFLLFQRANVSVHSVHSQLFFFPASLPRHPSLSLRAAFALPVCATV
jgi:hypothetical protein